MVIRLKYGKLNNNDAWYLTSGWRIDISINPSDKTIHYEFKNDSSRYQYGLAIRRSPGSNNKAIEYWENGTEIWSIKKD